MPTPSIFTEFKEFILKGDAITLAVGVIIGGAFGKVVEAVSKGIIEPILKLTGGSATDVMLKVGIFDLGLLINAMIALIMTGAILFFLFVRPMNKLRAKNAAPAPAPGPSTEEKLLTEIRDLLAKQ